ncbi:MAG: ABC-F family ATP-binding cassette domain-containing protein, partial [Eubacteriales bacterium]
QTMLNRVGIDDHGALVGTMSGGQRKRVALAAALLTPAEVYVLDEPTNHLDTEAVVWLEGYIASLRAAVVMVTHDRYFLERSVNRIVELSRGCVYNYEANYSRYLELKSQRAEYDQASERKRQSLLRVEYQWIMRGVRARGTKSKDRIERYEQLRDREAPSSDASVASFAVSSRLGRRTIELDGVSKGYGGKTVVSDFTYNFLRDDRIGIVGRNGVGKSTLLGIASGTIAPDAGSVFIGETVKIGYFTQESRELPLDRTVYSYVYDIADELDTSEGKLSASMMLERFLFPPAMHSAKIGSLSGGERRRLFLLGILMGAPNVLFLDEPTNDLDIETLTVLEDYISTFPGIVAAVSHDRYFLDKVAREIFEVSDGGVIRRFTGNFADYREKSADAAKAGASAHKAADTQYPENNSDRGRRPEREKKPKFTFAEQREYDSIEDDIAALEGKIADCDARTAKNQSDFVQLNEIYNQKEAFEAELEAKTERWLYLSELAEKIAAAEKTKRTD